MSNVDALRKRISQSMDLLDELAPDWPDKVDLDTLAMDNPKLCVAGQTVGFDTVIDAILDRHGRLSAVHEYYAFSATWDTDYPTLNTAWREAIVERHVQA